MMPDIKKHGNKRLHYSIILFTFSLWITACGQTGALYLPNEKPNEDATEKTVKKTPD